MKDKHNKYRRLMIAILFVSFLMVVAMIWYFTSQSIQVSDSTSKYIAKRIENTIGEYFVINLTDQFWRDTLDELVRKGAHFTEYFLLGSITCALLNVLFRRGRSAAVISLIICPIYAGIDEYQQNFVPGRGPRWFDWKMDVFGAISGIIMVMIVFLIFRYIYKLKARINELEERQDNQGFSRLEEKVIKKVNI